MSKKYEAVLFDLDGSLLPMSQDEFTASYFSALYKNVAAPLGVEKNVFVDAMWKGVKAMVKGDGSKPNEAVFWETFCPITGLDRNKHTPLFDAFYLGAFNTVKAVAHPSPLANDAVKAAKKHADKVVLATNPLFPPVAVEARLSWAGVDKDLFAHITDYQNSSFCKPNPKYYTEIAEKLGIDLKNCLMVGNNIGEDILPAASLGMDTFLLTPCLIDSGLPIPNCGKGTLEDFINFINKA